MDFFKPEEFRCKCDHGDECDAAPVDMAAVLKLNGLRLEFGQAMTINSACRCAYWNQKQNGEDNSWHLVGKAFDIHCPDGIYMLRLVTLALKHGFRVGIKKRMAHLDCGDGPQVIWGY